MSGVKFYDEVLGCDSGSVHQGYNKTNSILLVDGEEVSSINLNNGRKTTIISLSEPISSIDLDENDLKLYILTKSQFHILDMSSKTLISSRELESISWLYPNGIEKNNTSSAIYVAIFNTIDGKTTVYEFNEDSLASEPVKLFDDVDNDLGGSSMKFSEANNSLFFTAAIGLGGQVRQYLFKEFNLDNSTWTNHEVEVSGTWSNFNSFILDDNYGLIYLG